jgi:hypothetical protein
MLAPQRLGGYKAGKTKWKAENTGMELSCAEFRFSFFWLNWSLILKWEVNLSWGQHFIFFQS